MKNNKLIKNLKVGDYIAFGFNYNGGNPDEIIVDNISKIMENGDLMVHFLYGHHSLCEVIKPNDILAIGDNVNGTIRLKGWSGKYTMLQPNNELIKENIY